MTRATARVAVEAGADYIGIVFYPGSHRYVEPERAREIAAAVRECSRDGQTQIVGLFVNEPLDKILAVRELAGLDIIQLSGNESTDEMAALKERDIPFLGTVRAGQDAQDTEARFCEIVEQGPFAVHLDTHVPGMWGGSGVVGDWDLARDLAQQYRLFLAGGLDPENVACCDRRSRPFCCRRVKWSRNEQIERPFEDQSIYRRGTRCGRRGAMSATKEQTAGARPDRMGRFGDFGGMYAPETLMPAIRELESCLPGST